MEEFEKTRLYGFAVLFVTVEQVFLDILYFAIRPWDLRLFVGFWRAGRVRWRAVRCGRVM